ncbi:MAG TPA: SUMF1/EgtB/PvdO family nonheme iron enzyme [Candidatus Acidoferrum sp.]|nr:SUMF1/EgtB/PvdO family nonheme iron enzyme [Candidatus Acidoferrum sp.]
MLTMPTVAHDLLKRMSDARRRSDTLFRIVRPDSLYERPIAERHRIIFYIGHLEAFDCNLLGQCFGQKPFSPEFDRLFAFGIDPVGGGLPDDRPSDWPALAAVQDYVVRTRRALDERLSEENLDSRTDARDGFPLSTLLNVAVEHRLMHLETLAYMLHQLPLDRKIRQAAPPDSSSSPVVAQMISIPAGRTTLGLPRASEEFGWDNEYESDDRGVPAFEIDQYKVTNGQYLDFINAGGYETREFWSDDAWNWKTSQGISHPVFWRKAAGDWLYRTMFDEVPLPAEWPVYVSHAEAMAYARWAGKSLPSEEQWQRAAYGTVDGQQRRYPWGSESPSPNRGNFDFQHWNPTPVSAFPRGASAFGVHDILGNGWEWTSSIFGPLPGFKPFPFYKGYSADFFDGKHFVMKGGSARTAACMLRPTFRNWFQAHYQYVYAGFRCVSR